MIRRSVVLAMLVLLYGIAPNANGADPSALWHIVGGRCVPDQQAHHDPAPCTEVDLAAGYAVLKDIDGNTQFLLIPTTRVSGIEDKAILAPGAPNYFAAAWQARRYVDQRLGRPLPPEDIALAINSAFGRSQDQLHIHVDCIRPDVRLLLAQGAAAIGPHWAPFPLPLAGHRYRAMLLDAAALGDTNPFRLLAADTPQAEMGQHTLVLAGLIVGGRQAFVLLDDRVNAGAGDFASGESLEDHDCALGR